jgi:malonate-semialdehyde dehydrogenase (acetylating)/methylmalonate-semialdehyde dehydrogenase
VAASAFTGCAGQRCMAASVMVAVGDVDHIIAGMVEAGRKMKLGDEMGAGHQPGGGVSRIRGYIDDAERRGAKILLDGRNAGVDGAGGNWIGPTVIDGVTPDMPAWQDEIFGPVMSIVHVNTVDEAIALENSCPYGNAASIFTTNGGVARYAIDRFQAGMCGVNIGVPVPREPFAFGGWNDSRFGAGDMTGYDGYRFWTQPRKVTTRWTVAHDQTWMS